MNITQVTPGLIQIPPNGWGAIEKIIWEYKLGLEKLNNVCSIDYLNNIKPSDIVHIHVANLALEAAKKGIPYIFSLHDHHVVVYGKDSEVYKENLEAIKKSIISFTHAEFLINYFDETDKLFYLSHGVNTDYFKPLNLYRTEFKLLCIANNGLANNPSYDRKGFRYAIEAAKELNLPITIAGPENNKNFFDQNPDLLSYEKLNLIYHNPTEDEILKLYQEHSLFIHPSILEGGHPNLTILEAISCGLPVIGTYNGTNHLNGLIKIEPNTHSVKCGIEEAILNYKNYVNETQKTKLNYDWNVICKRLNKIYETITLINKEYTSEITKNLYMETFENSTINNIITPSENIEIISHFIGQPFVEIKGNSNKKFKVEFWDDTKLIHFDTIKSNMWIKANRSYYTKWTVKIYCDNILIYNNSLDYAGKKVYISFESKSLGDNIAWIPYVEEFRKKHNCEVVCSTFWNNLFEKKYPNIEFVNPGKVVKNLHGMYKIGWFYDGNEINYNLNPQNFRMNPLQKTASDILGLEYKEILPLIDFTPTTLRPIKNKYFCIANHSTAQAKYWNNKDGWQEVVDYIKSRGYEVILLSKEEDGYMGNKNPTGVIKIENKNIKEIMNYIYYSEGFIGLGSGLSWLSWAIDKKTILISGFSKPISEMKECIRIFVPDENTICNGCFNDYKLDPSDWNWCPKHKYDNKKFECTKSILSKSIIDQLDLS